jgi:flagellar basal body rod protein FlgB
MRVDIQTINTMTMLERKMDHATLQLKVAGENVNQARIPGATAHDVKPLSFKNVLNKPITIAQTNGMHLQGSRASHKQAVVTSQEPINSAKQLQSADRASSEFAMSVGVYQKQLSLVNMVLGSGN